MNYKHHKWYIVKLVQVWLYKVVQAEICDPWSICNSLTLYLTEKQLLDFWFKPVEEKCLQYWTTTANWFNSMRTVKITPVEDTIKYPKVYHYRDDRIWLHATSDVSYDDLMNKVDKKKSEDLIHRSNAKEFYWSNDWIDEIKSEISNQIDDINKTLVVDQFYKRTRSKNEIKDLVIRSLKYLPK